MPEKLEKIMKRIHVFFSNCDLIDSDSDRMIVPRKPMLNLLKELNTAVYEVMEQYEVTQTGREREIRKQKQKADDIINDADKTAEDIYAASMIYTDRILIELRDMIEQAGKNLRDEYDYLSGRIDDQIEQVTKDQSEIRDYLDKTKQNNKYKNIINDYNDRIEKRRKKEALEKEAAKESEKAAKEKAVKKKAAKEKADREDNTENIGKTDREDNIESKGKIDREDNIESKGKTNREDNIESIGKTDREDNTESIGKTDREDNIESIENAKDKADSDGEITKDNKERVLDERKIVADERDDYIKCNHELDASDYKKYNRGFDIDDDLDDDLDLLTNEDDDYFINNEKIMEVSKPIKKIASVVDASALSASIGDDTVKKVSYEIKVNPMYFQAVGEFSKESLDAEYDQWMNNPEGEMLDESGASKAGGKQGGGLNLGKKNKKNGFIKKKKR